MKDRVYIARYEKTQFAHINSINHYYVASFKRKNLEKNIIQGDDKYPKYIRKTLEKFTVLQAVDRINMFSQSPITSDMLIFHLSDKKNQEYYQREVIVFSA